MNIDDDLILNKKDNVIERHGEELLLFDSSTGKLFEINETGKIIWMMLDGTHAVREIKELLKDEYEGIVELYGDISDFLNKLLELGLIDKLE